ncbi:MAG: radical SAM family heme chaperone HemW [Bacteroidota bacterium]|nr:radical SAM family heme chaperone HemW [Bacteroidota bacterium]
MAGIYIHIPFCKQACHYCDFHFSTSLQHKDDFLKALKKEITLRKLYLFPETVNTIYFGGGTPSLLSKKELNEILDALYAEYSIASDAEITLEANPDDLTNEKLIELKDTRINRLSIGIQSFYDEDLKLMNRAHNALEAREAVSLAKLNGFNNISIDLIYGIPTLSHHKWRNALQIAFAMDVNHISAYCLTVEPKTALAHQVSSGKVKDVDEQHSAEQFEMLLEAMHKNEFVQYEISNFCKNGAYSRHNSNYWRKAKYLGLGPSAHSYNGFSRQWNVSNNSLYIKSLEKGELNFEKEDLTTDQRYNEYILTTLRTIWGTDLRYIEKHFGEKFKSYCLNEAESHLINGSVVKEKPGDAGSSEHLFLSDKGKLLADKIASDLFV